MERVCAIRCKSRETFTFLKIFVRQSFSSRTLNRSDSISIDIREKDLIPIDVSTYFDRFSCYEKDQTFEMINTQSRVK